MAKVVADQRARGGGAGRPVLIVLVVSMVLLGIYMIGLMTWSGSETPANPAQTSSQQSVNPASSANTSARVPTENPAYPSPSAPQSGTPGSAAAGR
jgi:cytoskeletal protein RodZ